MADLKTQIVNARITVEALSAAVELAYPEAGACLEALYNATEHLSDAEEYLQEHLDDPDPDDDNPDDDAAVEGMTG